MKQHIPEEFSTRLIDWSPFVIMGNTVPQSLAGDDDSDPITTIITGVPRATRHSGPVTDRRSAQADRISRAET